MPQAAHGSDDIYESPGCPICSAVKNISLYRRNIRTGTKLGEVDIIVSQCSGCGFVYNSLRVRQEILSEYYYSNPLASGQVYRDEGSQGYYTSLNFSRAQFFSELLKKQSSGKLLDIGCGMGGFLDALRQEKMNDWQLFGLEPSIEASSQAKAKGYTVETAMLADDVFSLSSFDAISLVSVLEHLPDLQQTLKRVSTLLKPDGIVFIEVPNLLSPELSLTGFFSLEHIQHFTPSSLASLLREYGLSDIIVDPDAAENIIRIIASPKMEFWSDAILEEFSDDHKEATSAVKKYAASEKEMLERLTENVSGSLVRWQKQGCNIAIYGAGAHTVELMSHFDLHAFSSILIDGDPMKQGTTFLDFPVFAPEQIVELGIDAILVSSHRFQDEIVSKIRQVAGENIEIALCYDE